MNLGCITMNYTHFVSVLEESLSKWFQKRSILLEIDDVKR